MVRHFDLPINNTRGSIFQVYDANPAARAAERGQGFLSPSPSTARSTEGKKRLQVLLIFKRSRLRSTDHG